VQQQPPLNPGPVIDPALEGPMPTNEKGNPTGQIMSMEMTQAAVAAVLEATGMMNSGTTNATPAPPGSQSRNGAIPGNQDGDSDVMLNASELLTQVGLSDYPC
jgi:hypothetical protein